MKTRSRKIKKNLFITMFSLATLIIWGCGIYYGQFIKENYQSVSVRIHGNKITKRALIRALENEKTKKTKQIPAVTLWNCLEDQKVENKELATVIKTRMIELSGDMNQVYPLELVQGTIPIDEDGTGCLVDEDTAYELFKNVNAVGNFIIYQHKKYCIRGILKTSEPIVILQTNNPNQLFANLEMVYDDKENGEFLAHDFLVQNDLMNSYTILDTSFYGNIIDLFSHIPAWFLGFYIIFDILKFIWKRRNLPVQVMLLLPLSILSWFIISWIMEFQFYIPERLIPTRWSDFTFWTEKYAAFKVYVAQLVYLVPVPKDVVFFRFAEKCVMDSIIAFISIIILTYHRNIFFKRISGTKQCLAALVLESAAALLLFYNGKVFHVTRGYFLMLPLFVVIYHIMDGVSETLQRTRNH